jgi:cytochrome c peroxidase
MKLLVFVLLFLFLARCNNSRKQPSFVRIEQLNAQQTLGRYLFFDKNLSSNKQLSCASCHQPNHAFADTVAFSSGVFGRKAFRNTPSIFNVNRGKSFHFDGAIPTLERQVLVPLLDHNEMNASLPVVLQRLSSNSYYRFLALKAFGKPIDAFVLSRALAAFERTLSSRASKFDRYLAGNKTILTGEEKRGWKLFSGKLNCIACHPAPDFTTHGFANNGFTKYEDNDQGRFRITGKEVDKGNFKIPSLRNCGITSPYMHDGSVVSLKKVINHYLVAENKHKNQSDFIKKTPITQKDVHAVQLFLMTLTDTISYVKQGVYK